MPIADRLRRLLTLPVTITSKTAGMTDDGYGNEVRQTATVETVGELQQRVSRQAGETEDVLSDTSWLLILPADTDIDSDDTVTADGVTFEVVGDPWPVRNPRTGVTTHLEASLQRVAGPDD